MLCRICYDETLPLITPCACKGTAAYVHEQCMLRWCSISPGEYRAHCEVCETELKYRWTVEKSVFRNPCALVLLGCLLAAEFWIGCTMLSLVVHVTSGYTLFKSVESLIIVCGVVVATSGLVVLACLHFTHQHFIHDHIIAIGFEEYVEVEVTLEK